MLSAIFLLLGIGVLVPWNAFISAKDYFQSRFCLPHGMNLESAFVVLYTVSSVACMGAILLLSGSVSKQPLALTETEGQGSAITGQDEGDNYTSGTSQDISPVTQRMQHQTSKSYEFWFVKFPLVSFLMVFIVQALFVLDTSSSEAALLWTTMISLIFAGSTSAMASAGVVAVAGTFANPQDTMHPFLQGQSVGGLAVSIANLVAAWAGNPTAFWNRECGGGRSYEDSDDNRIVEAVLAKWAQGSQNATTTSSSCGNYSAIQWGIWGYFTLGAVVSLACLWGFAQVDGLRESQNGEIEYSLQYDNEGGTAVIGGNTQANNGCTMSQDCDDMEEDSSGGQLVSRSSGSQIQLPTTSSQSVDMPHANDGNNQIHDDDAFLLLNTADEVGACNNTVLDVLWAVRGPTFCIFMTFIVTLSLFPGWTSGLASTRQCTVPSPFSADDQQPNNFLSRCFNDLYTPMTFVCFNTGDLVGRLMVGRPNTVLQRWLEENLVLASLMRWVFVPLLLSCHHSGSRTIFFTSVNSDVYSWVVQFAFAVSNGSLLSMAFARGPVLLPPTSSSPKVQEVMSQCLSFAVALGLLCGSFCSILVSTLFASET